MKGGTYGPAHREKAREIYRDVFKDDYLDIHTDGPGLWTWDYATAVIMMYMMLISVSHV